jgi:hypothetical protein
MDQQPPRRSSFGLAILAALAVAGSAVAVLIYQFSQKEKPLADINGFDLAKTQESRPAPGAPAAQAPSPSVMTDRTMVQNGGLGQMRFEEGGGSAQNSARKPADSFTEAVRKSEGKAQALAVSYTKRYPAIARYGKDWMSYPDLKKLNDDYMRDHNPIAFLRGVAGSKNFAKLLVKYAQEPAVQSFVKESISKAPGDLMTSAMTLLKQDSTIKTVVANVASALGLPPALTAGVLNGGQVDQNQIMGQVLQGTPGLQGAMQDPNVQKAMQQQGVNTNGR